jgi:hypothetical protein
MPLIKNLNTCPDLCGDSFRRKDFVLSRDFIRRVEMGKVVSVRTSTLKGAVVIETLRKISEPDVVIGEEALQAYANSEDWLCRKMQSLFQTVRHLGMNPAKMNSQVACMLEPDDHFIARGKDLIWIPVAAFYVGDERVYLFRTTNLDYEKSLMLNTRNTGVIGYTREALNTVSPELAAYIAKLENKAMDDPQVRESYTRLGSILRPEAYKQEMIEERAKMYGGEESFGGWA